MRDITKLHPDLQVKLKKLQSECEKQGLKISITECVRTVAEQDALYAKGRTAPGSKVTNAKGSSYSSMHQWGVAFDFCRNDGKGAYYNNDGFFQKVGKIGQSIGLEWGGSWKSIVDLPHFQLSNWGSTASTLKSKYGTPEKFMKTWNTTSSSSSTSSTSKTTTSNTTTTSKALKINNKVTATSLNIRKNADVKSDKVGSLKKGDKVTILSVSNGWYRIGTNKYVSAEYISSTVGTVNASSLNIRKKADADSTKVGSYKNGEKVKILAESNGFYLTPKGYVSKKYIV